ncbi:MAG: AzlC family ABC transporter permease [Gemmobacter sp.]
MTDPDNARRAFWRGARDALPFLVILVPFALLFGVVGTDAGLSLAQVMGFSIFVIAGASQFAAVQLLAENAPTLVVIASALMVNLRMAMYSAALTPHLGGGPLWRRGLVAYLLTDQSFAAAASEYDRRPDAPASSKLAYYLGVTVLVAPVWYGATLVGATAGTAIPASIPIDFALPITFIALFAPMLRSLPHLVAAAVSVTVALAGAGLPYNLGLLLAAPLAMAAGAATERRLARRGPG